MKKKEKKRVLLFFGICCFILVGILVFLIVVNISALNNASKNAKPWKELYHCVDMRIGNHDNADLTQMKRYYSVLESNPYIYAALSENERDFFTADKSVLYKNLYSYESIVDALKETITIEYIGLIVFLSSGVTLIYVYKNKQPKELNIKQSNGILREIVDVKNNSPEVSPKIENTERLK